jgi:hypothetical protein
VRNETSRGWSPPAPAIGLRYTLRKSGGRKPPVVCSRNANLTTEIPRIAVADAVCEPTAGSRPPLFFSVCVCASLKSFFRRQTFARQRESGGRKPPVVPINADATAIHTHAHTPSEVLRTIALVSVQRRFHTHGGLTPAAPGCGFANRSTMFDSHGTASGSPRHGGLTPAALFFGVRLCIEKTVFRRQTLAPQHKSGGRQPPVRN